MKDGNVETLEIGDVTSVRCSTHGTLQLIAGIHFSAGGPAPTDCPYCRLMTSGKKMCGEGYRTQDGEAYVVDVHGNLRKLSKLKPHQAERIRGRRKLLRRKEEKRD